VGLRGRWQRRRRPGQGRRKKLTDVLIWRLDWGDKAAGIRAAAIERDGEVPPLPFLLTEPDLDPHLEFEFRAFNDLSRDRQSGFGLGFIPWSSIDRYAARHGIDDADAFDRFAFLIFAMDDAYRADHAEKNPVKTK